MEKDALVLCDTNDLIELYKDNTSIISSLKEIGQDNIAISVITSAELIFGAFNKRELTQTKKDISHLKVLSLDEVISSKFLNLMSQYSLSHNLTIPDSIIAATALVYDIPLFTLNQKDFKYIDGLDIWEA